MNENQKKQAKTLTKRVLFGIGALIITVVTIAIVGTLVSVVLPYKPYEVRNYVVKPEVVCPGEDVTAYLERKFTADFDSLELKETWITVDVPGYSQGRPIKGNEGEIPGPALKPTDGFDRISSPFVSQAPMQPGVYRIKIEVEAHGNRWLFPAATEEVFFSNNKIRVKPCPQQDNEGGEG